MLVREMNAQERRDLLARLSMGRLACAKDDQPYVVPIYFAYEPDRLCGVSTVGQKLEWIRDNTLVCVEADEVLAHNHWESVVVLGRYEELPDKPEYGEARRQAQSVLGKRALWWQTEYAASQSRVEPKPASPVFYCIHIARLTGLRATADAVESSFSAGHLRGKVHKCSRRTLK